MKRQASRPVRRGAGGKGQQRTSPAAYPAAVPAYTGRGSGRLPHDTWATTHGAPASAGLADGVCRAWGGPSRAVSHLWPAARVHRRHPAGRGAAVNARWGVCRMTSISPGRSLRGMVCLAPASWCPVRRWQDHLGAPRAQGRGLPALQTGARAGATDWMP